MFLNLVHLRELRCRLCGELLAPPGARSFIVDNEGNPVHFSADHPPEQLVVELICSNGHATVVNVPGDISVEESMTTPDDAPVALDAVLRSS
jgi:hypothetical protein